MANTNWCLAFNNDIPYNKKERSDKINEYLAIAKGKVRTDINQSMEAALQAKKLSLGFDEEKLVASNIRIAEVYQQKGIVDSALILLKDALRQAKIIENDTLLAEAYHTLGRNHQYSGSTDLAIESYHNALKLNEALGLYESSLGQLNNIGLLYRDEEEYELALEYLEKCLRRCREKGYNKYEYLYYANVAYVLMKQNKWEEALERFEKTLELSQEAKDTVAFCTITYLIADVKLSQKDYPASKAAAIEAFNLANQIDFVLGKVYSKRVLSDVYRLEKNYDKARETINEVLGYLKGNSANLYLEDVLKVSYNIEKETGNYKKALEIQKQIFVRKDSLSQIKVKEKISNSEYKYQLLKNEKANQVLKIQNDSNERIALLATAIAFLLLLVVILSYFAYRKSENYNDTLEQAIAKRTEELEKSNIHLAKSNEELERFTFIASHDLKTPLRDIVSFTGLLEKELQSYENENVHEYLSFVKKGGMRLNNLIMDTLEYSKLSYLEREDKDDNIDLNLILEEVQKAMSIYFEERNAKIIKSNHLPSIKSNHLSITLLFQHLFENGLKYNTAPTPRIKVYSKENNEYISIFIEDNGIGISKEYQDKIFVMFSRLHNQNEYEGSGLGLSICKKIIEKLNGEILIQSELGKGSVFEIRLPHHLIVGKDISLNKKVLHL